MKNDEMDGRTRKIAMWMTDYIRAIKRQLRDRYGFKPSKVMGTPPDEELCFDSVPDGTYPMAIDGKEVFVKVINGKFSLSDLPTYAVMVKEEREE
jgi:hypothetical protein